MFQLIQSTGISRSVRHQVRLLSSTSRVVIDSTTFPSVVVVSLNRPKKLNALDQEMFKSVANSARKVSKLCEDNNNVKAVVIRANGKGFCAGLDVKSVMSDRGAMDLLLHRPDNADSCLAQDVNYLWRQIPVPVVCCIHGVCLGGGFQIALGADYRVASKQSKLSVLEAKWGIIPDMGITVGIRELMSIDKAKMLTMTAKMMNGAEAKEYNIVNEIVESPDAEDVFKAGMEFVESLVVESRKSSSSPSSDQETMKAFKAKVHQQKVAKYQKDMDATQGSGQETSEADHEYTDPTDTVVDSSGVLTLTLQNPNIPTTKVELESLKSLIDGTIASKSPKLCILTFSTSQDMPMAVAAEFQEYFRSLPIVVTAVFGQTFSGTESTWVASTGADFRVAHNDADLRVNLSEVSGFASACELVGVEQRTQTVDTIDRAKELGLVTLVSEDPSSEAKRLSKMILKGSPSAIAAAKLLYNNNWHKTEKDALLEESRIQVQLLYKYNMVAKSLQNFLPPFLHLPYWKVDHKTLREGKL